MRVLLYNLGDITNVEDYFNTFIKGTFTSVEDSTTLIKDLTSNGIEYTFTPEDSLGLLS